jgi:hypothetical protein
MKVKFFHKFVGMSFILILALFGFSCDGGQASQTSQASSETKAPVDLGPLNAQTPTDAYKSLYAAVKAKDNARIQQLMSKNTIGFAGFAIEQNKQPLEKFFENGLTATTFAPSLPEIRDERVKDNFGAVEVFSQKDNRWEDLPFVLEDGIWKLAVGDDFKGVYKKPGKGQSQIEMEASNPGMNEIMNPANAPGNSNSNTEVSKDKAKRNPVNTAEVTDENKNKEPAKANKK